MTFSISFITLAGTPTAIELSGISRLTTAPAPIITLIPIVTPGSMQTLAPIQTSLPIQTLLAWPNLCLLLFGLIG